MSCNTFLMAPIWVGEAAAVTLVTASTGGGGGLRYYRPILLPKHKLSLELLQLIKKWLELEA